MHTIRRGVNGLYDAKDRDMVSSNGNAMTIPEARNAARRDILEDFRKADIGHHVRTMKSLEYDFWEKPLSNGTKYTSNT